MPPDRQSQFDLFLALKEHLDARLDEIQAQLDELASGPPEPVTGLRQAADLLGVGKETVRRVIGELPENRRPARVGKRRGAWWWRSPTALIEWWEDAHGADRASQQQGKRSKERPARRERRVASAAGAPEKPRLSLADRLK